MWQLRPLTCFTPPEPQQALLSRETLIQQQQAQAIVLAAEAQAQQLLEAAQHQAQQILQQAEAEAAERLEEEQAHFWQQAQTLFDDWQQAREAQQQQIVQTASQLLSQALTHCLAEVPPAARLEALLTQLLHRAAPDSEATLCCSPARQPTLAAWLSARPALRWQLAPDDRLETDALRLIAQQGELHISWHSLCQVLGGG